MDGGIAADEKANVCDALCAEHDAIRAGLARATMVPGEIGRAARHLAKICLPHFEQEERLLFPIFTRLHDTATSRVKPDMLAVLPLVASFKAHHARLYTRHESIISAIAELFRAARAEGNKEVASFAHRFWLHERNDAAVIYPTAGLVGKYLRQRLGFGQKRRAQSLAGIVDEAMP